MTSERQLVAQIQALFAAGRGKVQVGIGDDAAIVGTTAKTALACDPVVEGVHFKEGTPLQQVGRKAVNRNLSDLAAMGCRPQYLLVSVLFPRQVPAAKRMGLFRGIKTAAQAAGAQVVGGDVGATLGPLVVTVSVIGAAPRQPLLRSKLRPGDSLHVTGALGGSILGKHLRFVPRLQEGQWLARQQAVQAAMDISDGLLLDLDRMLEASGGRGAELQANAIPIAAAARKLAKQDKATALQHALSDGEDHELLFAVRRGKALAAGGPLTQRARRPMGQVIAEPGIWLVDAHGQRRACPPQGYQHLDS